MARERFRGEDHLKMDSKGRISVPAGMRRVLENGDPDYTGSNNPTMVVVYGDHLSGCLECYTVAAMHDLEDLIDNLDIGSDEQISMQALYLAQSTEVTLDDNGRAVLPQKLRDKIGVSAYDQVYVRGLGQTFEIWNAEAFESKSNRVQGWLAQQGEGFNPKSILNAARKQRDAGT